MSELDEIESLEKAVDIFLIGKSKEEFNFLPAIFCDQKTWQLALQRGRVKLARQCVEILYDFLIANKRIPEIKKLAETLQSKKFLPSMKLKIEENLSSLFLNERHPEMVKKHRDLLLEFLLGEKVWDDSHWKLAYEYILRHGEEEELFIEIFDRMLDFSLEKKKEVHEEMFHYLIHKNPNLKKNLRVTLFRYQTEKNQRDLAFVQNADPFQDRDIFSRELIKNAQNEDGDIALEERKVLVLVREIPKDDLLKTGKEYATSLAAMGMNKAVKYIIDLIINEIGLDKGYKVKEVINLKMILCHALLVRKKYYDLIDLCQDIELQYPLLRDEKIELRYLTAECYFMMQKYSMAKYLYQELAIINKNYKLVQYRLKEIENSK